VHVKPAVALTLAGIFLGACSTPKSQEQPIAADRAVAEKPFAPGGNIDLQLDGGDYTVGASSDNHIHVFFGGNSGGATADVNVDGQRANVAVKNTPHSDFRASIELPSSSNIAIHLSGGNLRIEGITGNKDINSGAGNVEVAIADPNDYSTADGSVKAGDIDASAFGKSASGLNPHFVWQGPGKYTLRATLGAGNLLLKKK
jgi:hypothetical protein